MNTRGVKDDNCTSSMTILSPQRQCHLEIKTVECTFPKTLIKWLFNLKIFSEVLKRWGCEEYRFWIQEINQRRVANWVSPRGLCSKQARECGEPKGRIPENPQGREEEGREDGWDLWRQHGLRLESESAPSFPPHPRPPLYLCWSLGM